MSSDLPVATAREWLRQFREYHTKRREALGTGASIQWRSQMHQAQLRVRELRRANPRRRHHAH